MIGSPPPGFDPSGVPPRIEIDVVPRRPDGVMLAHGGASFGYALELVDGRPRFSVRDRGRVWSATMPSPSPSPSPSPLAMDRPVRLIARLDANGAISVGTSEVFSAVVPATVLTAPPAESLQLGEDRGSIVGPDGDLGPFVGRIQRVRIVRGGNG